MLLLSTVATMGLIFRDPLFMKIALIMTIVVGTLLAAGHCAYYAFEDYTDQANAPSFSLQ
jgi:hypothetical protein